MARFGKSHNPFVDEDLFERAWQVVARRLLVLGPDEPVTLLADAGSDPDLLCRLRERIGPQRCRIEDLGGGSAEEAGCVLERRLEPLAAAPGLKSIIELSERTHYMSPAIVSFLAAGGRLLSLGNLSEEAFVRCVGGTDTGALRAFGAALRAILAAAERIEIRTSGGGAAAMRMTPTSKHRLRSALLRRKNSLLFANPIPVLPGQLAFLPGQAAFLGVPQTIAGRLAIDGYCAFAGKTLGIDEPIEIEMNGGVVTSIRGGAAAASLRAETKHSRTTLQHVCIGFHPAARMDRTLIEAERTVGAVTIGLGGDLFHADGVLREADLIVDGEPVLRQGRFVHPCLNDECAAPALRQETGRAERWLRSLGSLGKSRHLPITRYAAPGKEARAVGYPPWEKYLLSLYLDAKKTPEPSARTTLLSLGAGVRAAAEGAGLTLIGAHPLAMRGSGLGTIAFAVPTYLSLRLTPDEEGLKAFRDNGNIRRVKRAGLTARWMEYEARRFAEFYESYYVPTALWHGECVVLQSFENLREEARSGELLAVFQGETPIAMGLFVREDDEWRFSQLGVREGDRTLTQQGGPISVYYHGIQRGWEIGCKRMAFGRSAPVLTNGVVRHKVNWGCHAGPWDDERTPLDVILDLRQPGALALLEAHPLAVFAPGGDRQTLFGLGTARNAPEGPKAFMRTRWAPGLRSFLLLVDGPEKPRLEAWRQAAQEIRLPFQFQALPADPSPRWLVETAREHFRHAPAR